MSTVVFLGSKIPDKKLIQEHVYRYYPDGEMKAQILREIEKHVSQSLDGYIVDVKIEVSLKEYDKKQQNQPYWYEPYDIQIQHDTKNT